MKRLFLLLLLCASSAWAQDLRPSAYLGLPGKITVRGGKILGTSGGVTTIAEQTLTPADDTTTYVYIDLSGTPALSTSTSAFPAASYFPICTVVKSHGLITSFTDNRPDSFMAGGTSSFTINAQAGNYSTTAADFASCKLITETVTSTVTLLNPAPTAGQCITVENVGVALTGVIIGRNSLTINGVAANVTVNSGQGVTIISDGTNYVLSSGGALGSVPLTPAGAVTINQPNTGSVPLTITQSNGGDVFFLLKRGGTTIMSVTGVGGGTVNVSALGTMTNCSSSAAPAVCGSAAAGSVAVPTGTNPTLTVNTTAVTDNSQIFVQSDDTLGTKLSVTCNSTLASLAVEPVVTTRVNATSFTITINGVISTNPVCLSYFIVN